MCICKFKFNSCWKWYLHLLVSKITFHINSTFIINYLIDTDKHTFFWLKQNYYSTSSGAIVPPSSRLKVNTNNLFAIQWTSIFMIKHIIRLSHQVWLALWVMVAVCVSLLRAEKSTVNRKILSVSFWHVYTDKYLWEDIQSDMKRLYLGRHPN